MILANIQALLVARTVILALGAVLSLFLVPMLLGMRYIPSNRVGIVERLWSLYGSIREGRLMAMAGQAGYQSAVLRGGFRFLLGWCQCQIRSLPLAVIPQDKIGYVFARDGEPLKRGAEPRPGRPVRQLPGRDGVSRREPQPAGALWAARRQRAW